jgi:uncharacterized membrane protein
MKTLILAAITLFGTTSAFATDMTCGGTEPFWNIQITGKTLTYQSPTIPNTKLNILSATDAAGTPDGLAKVIKTKYTTLTIVRGEDCTDAMSDQTYTHHAIYTYGANVFYGCCNLK